MAETRVGTENPEIGGIVHLDHINFETPDHEMATVFFMNGLGLTRDPYRRADEQNMGVNVGYQQFHLPKRGVETPPFHGVVGLVVPDLGSIKDRFVLLKELGKFDGTPFAWEEDNGSALVTSPFGYRLRLHSKAGIAFSKPLGIAYVEFAVPLGRAQAIAQFYRKVMRAPTHVHVENGKGTAIVAAGPHQEMRFVERELDSYETYTMHVSYHVTHYNEIRETLGRHDAMKGISRGEVLFFDKIFDPETGDLVFKLQNEVRSIYHPDFMRQLINRWPMDDEPFTDQTTAMRDLVKDVGFMPGATSPKR